MNHSRLIQILKRVSDYVVLSKLSLPAIQCDPYCRDSEGVLASRQDHRRYEWHIKLSHLLFLIPFSTNVINPDARRHPVTQSPHPEEEF